MAKVRCSCGRVYNVPDDYLGKLVQCAVCKRKFMASAVAAPPRGRRVARARRPASRLRLGELAVARGLITREQLSACLKHLSSMRNLAGQEELRLGTVLVNQGLLSRGQLDRLLGEQQGAGVAAAAASIDLSRRTAPPVTDEQRAALRRSVEAATQQEAERREAYALLEPGLLDRLHFWHFALVAGLALAAFIVVRLWPEPAPQKVLEAYLGSCDDANIAPDTSLAFMDLGLAIRECGKPRLLPPVRFDYGGELAAFPPEAEDSWAAFLEAVQMPYEKAQALWIVLSAMPAELTPRKVGRLEIAVQPAVCRLVSRRRGMGMYIEGYYRFLVLRARTPAWDSGWRVGACEPTPAPEQ